MAMIFTTRLENFHDTSDLWGHHLVVPAEVVDHFRARQIKRLICTLNGVHQFHCALMPKGEGVYFININAGIRKKLRLRVGTEVKVHLAKDESQYGMPMPEEFQELLRIDDEGDRLFHALTKGKQRSLLYIIGKPKSSSLRLKKALVVVDYLKHVGGRLDFRELNEAFKEDNNKW